MLDKVCSRTKFHLTYFDAKVWIFHVRLIWWAVSSSIHKFSLISNVCTFKLQFEFLNVFLNFEFRFNHKYLLRMRKAQDHVLQQRWIRYTRYDRESLRKPSERKWYCKKGQIKRREALDGWGNVSADRYVRRKALFVGRFWQRVYETGRQRNSLYGDKNPSKQKLMDSELKLDGK